MSEPSPQPAPTTGTLPRDIQGILALIVIVGAFAVAGVAVYLNPANVTSVLASILPLASVVVGFYFGQKSQQPQT